ncbi:hypothetical protein [Streptomyces sp. t39]|uniref:hypothetical protein n=1 Tax=Streptomyces sp. t39 TaxID=1828156 RepID=UPI0011CE1D74|nr:hypothetical protein [Streptomyces sp. t39]TXS51237.1 hypothetical protein EAO77_25475 [Streptomyces sp. t39]
MNEQRPDGAPDVEASVDRLREALGAHGITLPSLGVDLPSYAGALPCRHLVALGNCSPATADLLTAALRRAEGR